MAEVVLTKQKVKSGKTEQLREWMSEIQERDAEAVETLQSEGMHSEAAFLEQAEDGDYLVYYMEAENLRQVYESFEESSHDIDEEHKEVMDEVLEDGENIGNYELLYHMVNPERP
jgi:hypothetical protein